MLAIVNDANLLNEAAEKIGVRLVVKHKSEPRDGKVTVRFRLFAIDKTRLRHHGPRRWTPNACFHAYKKLMSFVFERDPDAMFHSALSQRARYRWITKDNFEDAAIKIKYLNVGSHLHPLYYGVDCCACID